MQLQQKDAQLECKDAQLQHKEVQSNEKDVQLKQKDEDSGREYALLLEERDCLKLELDKLKASQQNHLLQPQHYPIVPNHTSTRHQQSFH